jgi:hypothetical protein
MDVVGCLRYIVRTPANRTTAMNITPRFLFSACLALLCSASTTLSFAAEPAPRILAQDLIKARDAGKAGAVLWTRRTDSYTLQVVLPRQPERIAVRAPAQPAAVKSPEVEVWLLRLDGSRIPWLRRWESPAYENPQLRGRQVGAEVNFSFPLSAGKEAVTAAIQIGQELFIEKLEPLPES